MNRSLKGICFTVAGGCCWGMSESDGEIFDDMLHSTAMCLTVRLLGAGNLPAVAYVSEKREFNFSCMEKKRFSGQSADR